MLEDPPELAVEEPVVSPLKYTVVKVPFKLVPVIVITVPRTAGLGVIAKITGVPVSPPATEPSPPPHPVNAAAKTHKARAPIRKFRTSRSYL